MATASLRAALDEYRRDAMTTDKFVALWREQGGQLCTRLPMAYRTALDDLLMRTESSRLFSGDSCSFSRDSLMDAFTLWLDKAELRPTTAQNS